MKKKPGKSECGILLLKICIIKDHISLGLQDSTQLDLGQKDLGTVIFTLNAEDFFKQKNRWPPATWTHILTVSQGKKLPKSPVRNALRIDLYWLF